MTDIVLMHALDRACPPCLAVAHVLAVEAGRQVRLISLERMIEKEPERAVRIIGHADVVGFDIEADENFAHLAAGAANIVFLHSLGHPLTRRQTFDRNAVFGKVLKEGGAPTYMGPDKILLPPVRTKPFDPKNPFRTPNGQMTVAVLARGVPHGVCRNLHHEYLSFVSRRYELVVLQPSRDEEELAMRFENLSAYLHPGKPGCAWSCELTSALCTGVPVFTTGPDPGIPGVVRVDSQDAMETLLTPPPAERKPLPRAERVVVEHFLGTLIPHLTRTKN